MAHAQDFQIDIDEGTVNVELTDAPMAQPYEISFAPQGSCQPEVAFTPVAEGLRVRHTKNCHGTGYQEGTIFTLRLSTASSHALKLKAGRVNLAGTPGLAGFGNFEGEVAVGKISNRRRDLAVQIARQHLVGAIARYSQPALPVRLATAVTYGEINIL